MAHDSLEYPRRYGIARLPIPIGCRFKIDASIANADERAFAAYSRLGEEIRLAFHVIDDQINVVPLTEEWSKTTAEDIAAGTVTLQVLLILQRADRNRAAELVRILRASTTDQRELRNAVGIMRERGALIEARAIVGQHLDACLRIISNISNMNFRYRP